MIRYVGIDLHKHLIVGHVVDAAGKELDTFRYESVTPVTLEHIGQTRLTPEDQVVLEATTHCWAVVRALEPFVARVVVSNPMATKAIAKAKVKTDKVDAAVLAHLLRLGYLPEVWQPDHATRDLREWTARRSRLVGQRTAVINRLRSTLAQRLLDCPHDMTCPAARDWIAGQDVDDDTRWLLESDLRLMDSPAGRVGRHGQAPGEARLCRSAGETVDDPPRRQPAHGAVAAGGDRRHHAVPRRRRAGQLSGTGPQHAAIGQPLLSRPDHQAGPHARRAGC